MDTEFDLISRYFRRAAPAGMLGVGDDCALLAPRTGWQMATSTDLLIEGTHFLAEDDPGSLGHKALAVNISDLAAMGAEPLACLLGLSLPRIDHTWLAAFTEGFHCLAQQARCPLIGGDTTRSPAGLVISVTVLGQVPAGQALLRSAARPEDDIWVTGLLGAADVALQLRLGKLPANPDLLAATRDALDRPDPPWSFAPALAGLAHAALDISDGLLQDLGHILEASHCGARLDYARMPIHPAVSRSGLDPDVIQRAVLAGGDVYQLCFTAPSEARDEIQACARRADVLATRVGVIREAPGLHVIDAEGQAVSLPAGGFDHFS